MNKRYKIGDRVRIHCKRDKKYNIGINDIMALYDGIVTKVVGITEHYLTYCGYFTIYRLENDVIWKWTEDMLTLDVASKMTIENE